MLIRVRTHKMKQNISQHIFYARFRASLCLLWTDVLERDDKVNLILQAKGLCLKEYLKDIHTNFVHYEIQVFYFLVFSKLFDDVESQIYYYVAKRSRTRERHFTKTDRNNLVSTIISHIETNFNNIKELLESLR